MQGIVGDTGECALRDSGKHYTVVRPGQLTNDAASQHKLITGRGFLAAKYSHGLIQLAQQGSRAESSGPVASLCTACRFLYSLLVHAGSQAAGMRLHTFAQHIPNKPVFAVQPASRLSRRVILCALGHLSFLKHLSHQWKQSAPSCDCGSCPSCRFHLPAC